MKRRIATLSFLLASFFAGPALAGDAAALYANNCASCHGEQRFGAIGPALIPESLGRVDAKTLAATIANGRVQTQMPAFGDKFSADDIAALADYISKPLGFEPVWGEAEIAASAVKNPDYQSVDKPVFSADPMNLFVVVETGDHHATILDGDRFEPITRFPTRFALHGGPKFSSDGRFVYFMSRDGWITKYDIWALKVVAEVRGGINSRNIALSKDGKHIALANYLPHSLVILSADDLSVEKIFEAKDAAGNSSRVSAVYQARPRDSFVVALKDVPELWEIATDPNAPPVYPGKVHSYEKGMVEALPSSQGLFAQRRILLSEPLDDFFFTPNYANLIGSSRKGGNGIVVNLNVGREIASVDLPGFPHLGSGISWMWNGKRVMATPNLKEAKISIIDMETWKVIKTLDTLGPGFFMRSHDGSPYAWTDVFFGPNKDAMHVIDKRTLEIVKTLRPEPGKTAAHVEFDKTGAHALVSIWEDDGAVIVYDAKTLEEVKRIPMRKPSGKYNVWNKINFEDGTSH